MRNTDRREEDKNLGERRSTDNILSYMLATFRESFHREENEKRAKLRSIENENHTIR